MKSLWKKLLMDESGVVISSELALVGTVGVLGMAVGLEAVTSSVTSELNDLASAFGAIDQSFNYRSIGKVGHAWVRGSGFNDRGDFCDCGVISQTDVGGLVGASNIVSGEFTQGEVAQAAVVSAPVVQETVVEERVVDEVLVEPEVLVECPDEIIEEHIIRRRVRADCDKTLRVVPKAPKATLQPHSPNLKPHPELDPMPKSKPQPQSIEPKSKPKKKG